MPVYTSHLLAYDALKLGDRIREARQRAGLTLKQLAERVQTSPARLSQLENDRLRLDVADVLLFAAALQVPLESLFPVDGTLPYHLERDADVRSRPPQRTLLASALQHEPVMLPHAYWPLGDLFVGRHLEPVLGRISPVDDDDLVFCYHGEEEFAFALRGTIEFRIKTPQGEKCEVLTRGDCVYFRSDLPHCFRSLDKQPADSLHVFCSPSATVGASSDRTSYRAIAYEANGNGGDVQRQIGDRLRLLREIHGWSLERVARAANLTVTHIQRIERGERPMPVDAVLQLARAVGKPVREFMGLAAAEGPSYVLRRSSDIPGIPNRKRRTPVERPNVAASKTCQPLVARFPAREMYPYFLRMLNVDRDMLTEHEHHGQEFIYVLEGELELITYAGGQQVRETIRAGDSCYIDSTVPHLLRSWTRNPYSETSAQVIDVFWCPLGEEYLFES